MLIKQKVEQAKKLLRENHVDCWITFARETQINGDPILPFLAPADLTWPSAFLVFRDGETLAIVGEYDRRTVEDVGAWDTVIGYVESIEKPLTQALWEKNPVNIALNYSEGSEICDGLTHGMYLNMMRYLNTIKMDNRVISAENIISALRERKSEAEIAEIKQAISETERIFEEVTSFIRPGKTEKEIASFMKAKVKERGLEPAWEPMVCPAVFTGPDTAGAHYEPTDKKVEYGHILNMDFGVKVNGYCSDMQRTFYIMHPDETVVPAEVQKGFDTIVQAIRKSKEAMKPGVLPVEIDTISRECLKQNGYEEFPHGLGHQVGRYSHDGTALLGPAWEKYAQKPFRKLEAGMVFTLEPRLTVPGRGTATIEEMVQVTENGCEWMSQPQTELILIRM